MRHSLADQDKMMATLPRVYKVVVFGEGGVGKSAITMQYVSNVFLDFHDPTIEDVFQAQSVIDGEAGILSILDTAGQDGVQTAMAEQHLRQGEGYIAVYSITSASSFERLRHHIGTLLRLRSNERLPLVIVGNKLDLFNQRQVSTVDGVALAREFDCPFYETSAANRINVEDVFHGLVRQIRKYERGIDDGIDVKKKSKVERLKRFVVKKLGAL